MIRPAIARAAMKQVHHAVHGGYWQAWRWLGGKKTFLSGYCLALGIVPWLHAYGFRGTHLSFDAFVGIEIYLLFKVLRRSTEHKDELHDVVKRFTGRG